MVQPINPINPINQSDLQTWVPRLERLAPPPPPLPAKLKPNAFARLARWSWRNAYLVLGFWMTVLLVATLAAAMLYQRPTGPTLAFPVAHTKPDAGAEAFRQLARLQVLTLANPDTQELVNARDGVLSALAGRSDLFAIAFAPGAGDFYDENGLLYRPLDEVQARVAYALSLKPLFEAVKNAPESASMATLLDAMATAVTQGRDPQGLDDMLSEAAVAVQALNIGEDQPLDWAKIADLEIENRAKQLSINILARQGKDVEAADYLSKISKATGVETALVGNAVTDDTKPKVPMPVEKFRLMAALLMGALFAALLLAIVFGRLVISVVALAPAIIMAPLSFAIALRLGGASWPSLWPIIVAGAVLPCALSFGLMLAAAELVLQQVSDETAMMLAAHHNGKNLFLKALFIVSPFVGLAFLPLPQNWALATSALALAITTLAISFSLPPALSRILANSLDWRGAQWLGPAHRSLFETGQWQVLSHGLGVVLILASFVTLIASPRGSDANASSDVTAVVLAADQDDAAKAIERLRTVPSAMSVQWLGSFLPEQAPEKLQSLRRLHGQFPRIEPVGLRNPADIRDIVETMQDSLRQMAQTTAARTTLKESAQAFRQSLAVLAATSEDVKLRQLDNRLFGGFNRTAEKADALAALTTPTLETLPDGLHALFGNAQGPFRLVVTPVEGLAAGQLAQTLSQLGFPVLHPSVTFSKTESARLATLFRLLAVAAGAGLLLLALAAESLSGFILTLGVGLAASLGLAGAETLWQQSWSLQWLLALCLVCGWLACCLAASPAPQRATLRSAVNLFLLPGALLLAGVPLALLGLAAPAQQLLPMAVDMLVVSTVVGLFQRHGAAQEDF